MVGRGGAQLLDPGNSAWQRPEMFNNLSWHRFHHPKIPSCTRAKKFLIDRSKNFCYATNRPSTSTIHRQYPLQASRHTGQNAVTSVTRRRYRPPPNRNRPEV